MSRRGQTDPIVIDDSDDTSDDEAAKARAQGSKRQRHFSPQDSLPLKHAEATSGQAEDPGSVAPTSAPFNNIDRKALDEARRQRQKARRRAAGLRSESEDEGETASSSKVANGSAIGAQDTYSNDAISAYSSRAYESRPFSSSTATSRRILEDRTTGSSSWGVAATSGLGGSTKPAVRRILADERFWDQGVVKRSYNRFSGDGVPFSDFLLPTTKNNPAGLQYGIFSSFCWDWPWLAQMLPTRDVVQPGRGATAAPQLTFITLETPGELDAGVHDTPLGAVLAVKSLGREYSSMHMKFAMLFYPDRFRLVILTGNIFAADWDVLENAAFIQDFPILAGGRRDTSSDAYEQLHMVLKSLDVPSTHPGLKALSRYDLSKGPTIVASIAKRTAYRGKENIERVGLGRLSKVARDAMGGVVGAGGVDLEAQGSSMGTYSQRWMQQFHLAASGCPLATSLPLPKSAVAATRSYRKSIGAGIGSSSSEWPPVKVVFPTSDFVRNRSAAGPEGGGCHFGKPEKFEAWRSLCHRAQSNRHGGILMHQKGLLALKPGVGTAGADDERVGYVLMTSANFTSAAWGNISAAATDGEMQMTANNWELGVLLPVTRKDLQPAAHLSTNAASAICWRRPAQPYGPTDVPWSPFA